MSDYILGSPSRDGVLRGSKLSDPIIKNSKVEFSTSYITCGEHYLVQFHSPKFVLGSGFAKFGTTSFDLHRNGYAKMIQVKFQIFSDQELFSHQIIITLLEETETQIYSNRSNPVVKPQPHVYQSDLTEKIATSRGCQLPRIS